MQSNRFKLRLTNQKTLDGFLVGKSKLLLDKSFYTVSQAAQALDVDARVVEACLRFGKLTCYKTPGGHRKISKSALYGLIAQ